MSAPGLGNPVDFDRDRFQTPVKNRLRIPGLRQIFLRGTPVAARGVTLVVNALMAVVVARLFGAEASGEFFLAFAAVNLAGMIGRLGTENQAIKSLPLLFHSGRVEAFWCELVWLRRLCLTGSSIAALALALCGLGLWTADVGMAIGIHLIVLAASIPFSSASILESAALRSAERISRGAFAETGLTQGATIVSLVALEYFFDVGPLAASICYSVSAVLTAVLSRYWTRQAINRLAPSDGHQPVRPSKALRASMLHMMGSSVLFFLLTSSPLFVLGISATARDVGLYNAATKASMFIAVIPALQTTYLVPRVARSLSSGDNATANGLLRRAARQAVLASFTAAAVMAIFGNEILAIFGSDFADALPTLTVLLVGQAVLSLLGNPNPIMSISGLERRSLALVVLILAIGLPPMFFAASGFGAVGVAALYVVVLGAYAVASNASLLRQKGIRCFVG